MSVKPGPQSLLIQVMGNQTDASAQYKEPIQHTHVQVIFRFLRAESAAIAHHVDETHRDTAINVEDQIVFFGGGDSFDGNGVVEHFARGEVLLHKFFDEFDSEIGIVSGLDLMANPRNCFNVSGRDYASDRKITY